MAIFFSRIFRLSLLSTAACIPAAGRLTLLLENAAHVVQQRSGGREDRPVHPVQKKPGVLVPLSGRQLQPADGLPLILGEIPAQQVRLAQRVLGVLAPVLSTLGEQLQRTLRVFGYRVRPGEQELPNLVLGK